MNHRSNLRLLVVGALLALLLSACELFGEGSTLPGKVELSVSFDGLMELMASDDLTPAGVPIGASPDYVIVRVYSAADYSAFQTALTTAPTTVEPMRVRFSADNVQSSLGGQTMFVVPASGSLKLSVTQATLAAPNELVIVANVVDAVSAPLPTPEGEFPATATNMAFGTATVTPAASNDVIVPVRALASAVAADSELAPRLPVAYVYPGASYDWLLRIRTESIGGTNYPIPFQDAEDVAFTVSSGTATLTQSNVGVRAAVQSSADANLILEATADVLVRVGAQGDFAREQTLTITAAAVPYGDDGLTFDTAAPTVGSLAFDTSTRELTGIATDADSGIASLRIYEGVLLVASTVAAEQVSGVAAVTFGAGGSFGTEELTLLPANGDQYELNVVAVDLAGNQGSTLVTVGPIGSPPGADAVYYVARNGGSDDTGTGTFALPWATISYAVGQLGTAGQTLYFKSGTYPEDVTINSGTYVIDGQTNASRVIDGDVTITGAGTTVTLRNVTIDGNLTVGVAGTPVASFVMENVIVTGAVTTFSLASTPAEGNAFFCAAAGTLSGTVTNLTLCTSSNLTVSSFEVEEEITFVDDAGQETDTPPANVVFEDVTAPNSNALDGVRDLANVWVGEVVDATADLGSKDNPYATIAAGHAAVNAGGTVNVKAGTYPETVAITKSVSFRGPNAAIAGDGTRVAPAIVQGTNVANLGSAFRVDAATNLTISIAGFDLVAGGPVGSWGPRGILIGNTNRVSGSITISNNVISGWTTGISLAGGGSASWVDNITITGNKLVGNSIGSTENATDLTIQNNAFDGTGLGLGGGASLAAPITGNSFVGTSPTRRYIAIATGVDLDGQTLDQMLAGNTFDTAVSVSAATGSWYAQAIFATISPAVSSAVSGATLKVLAGTYAEFVTVDKPLTLQGPNAGVHGTGTRSAEAVITYPSGLITPIAELEALMAVSADDVTIDGFTVRDQDYLVAEFPVLILTDKVNRLTVRNNRLVGGEIALYVLTADDTQTYRNGLMIERNYIDGGPFVNSVYHRGMYIQATAGTIQDNVLVNMSIGIQYMPYAHPDAGVIRRNEVSAGLIGLYHNYQNVGAAPVTWSDNVVRVAPNDQAGSKRDVYLPWNEDKPEGVEFRGIHVITHGVYGTGSAPEVTFRNNDVDAFRDPSEAYHSTTRDALRVSNGLTGKVTVVDNSFTNYTNAVNYVDDCNAGAGGCATVVEATCNWWGTDTYATIAASVLNLNPAPTIAPFLVDGTDTLPSTIGFQPDPGVCTGVAPD